MSGCIAFGCGRSAVEGTIRLALDVTLDVTCAEAPDLHLDLDLGLCAECIAALAAGRDLTAYIVEEDHP